MFIEDGQGEQLAVTHLARLVLQDHSAIMATREEPAQLRPKAVDKRRLFFQARRAVTLPSCRLGSCCSEAKASVIQSLALRFAEGKRQRCRCREAPAATKQPPHTVSVRRSPLACGD